MAEHYISILTVDDDNTSLEVAAAIVGSIGILAEKTDSGKTAIDMCGTKGMTLFLWI
ncbi:MAG: CheY-like chemotaxis protein [Candidatus Endobugula sp.]